MPLSCIYPTRTRSLLCMVTAVRDLSVGGQTLPPAKPHQPPSESWRAKTFPCAGRPLLPSLLTKVGEGKGAESAGHCRALCPGLPATRLETGRKGGRGWGAVMPE